MISCASEGTISLSSIEADNRSSPTKSDQSYDPIIPTSLVGTASINLASIDLNLLVALDALLHECNVTHAASMVGLSQPAMSRILARLRGMFDDDLLVRTSTGYVRTMLGEWLHEHLPTALNAIRKIVSPRIAAAADFLAMVSMAMPDHQALLLGKDVAERLTSGEKHRELAIEPLAGNVLKRLESGDLEMVLGEFNSTAAGFFQRSLYVDDYVCLLRPDHPMLGCSWTPDQFYRLHHVLRPAAQDCELDHVADALMKGPHRSRYTVSPNTMSAAMAVVDSEMVLTVPRRAATKLAQILNLRTKEPPILVSEYRVALLWHERSHRNPEHEWIRSQMAAAALSSAAADSTHH